MSEKRKEFGYPFQILYPTTLAMDMHDISQFQVLKEGELANTLSRIPESGSSSSPFILESTKEEEEVVVKEIVQVPERVLDREDKQGKKRKTLRTGSEGDEVQLMQVSFPLLPISSMKN